MTYGAGFKASARNLSEEAQAALEALGRQALHAGELAFVHPVTGKRLRFASPLPADMARLADALGGKRARASAPKRRAANASPWLDKLATRVGSARPRTPSSLSLSKDGHARLHSRWFDRLTHWIGAAHAG